MMTNPQTNPGVMYTQCPFCKTLFKITAAQLDAAHGDARCGCCHRVFNAQDSLRYSLATSESSTAPADTPAPAAEKETNKINAPARPVKQNSKPFNPTVTRMFQSDKLGGTIDREFEQHEDETESKNHQIFTQIEDDFGRDVHVPHPSTTATEKEPETESAPPENAFSDVEQQYTAEEPLQPSPEPEIAPETISLNAIEDKDKAADHDVNAFVHEDKPQEDDKELDFQSLFNQNSEAFEDKRDTLQDIDDAHPRVDPVLSNSEVEEIHLAEEKTVSFEDREIAPEKPDEAPEQEVHTQKEPVPPIVDQKENDLEILRSLIIEQSGTTDTDPAKNIMKTAALALLVVILTVLFVTQYAYFSRNQLVQTHPQFRPYLETICGYFSCTLPLRKDTTQLKILNRTVVEHPNVNHALVINITFTNKAAFTQPYPGLRLNLIESLNGTILSSRDFLPSTYLPGAPGLEQGLKPSETVDLVLEVVKPQQRVNSFSFDFF